ncbi:MAG: ScpA family protein [Patescibacteria group bacterium]
MIQEKFSITTPAFTGPLDLLLQVIEKRQLFINDITLAKVTDDFISYIEGKGGFPVGEIAEFIVIASTLLLIKSKSLLPNLELSPEEKGDIIDLENRLKEYKIFKDLSRHIQERFGKKIIYFRTDKFIEPVFTPGPEISLQSIYGGIQSVIAAFPALEKLPTKTVRKVMSLEETIEKLLKRIGQSFKTSFKEFSGKTGGKENIIVSFLAVLELIKRGTVEVSQENHFGEINIENAAQTSLEN